MKIKTTLKKLKRGDVVSIDWIDAGDLDDSPPSWFSEANYKLIRRGGSNNNEKNFGKRHDSTTNRKSTRNGKKLETEEMKTKPQMGTIKLL